MSSGIITTFALLAFIAIVIWVFIIKRKEDFDEQAHMPLEEDKDDNKPDQKKDKEQSS